MPKLVKSNTGQFTISIHPEIVRLINLEDGQKYDWKNVNGFPALVKSKEVE